MKIATIHLENLLDYGSSQGYHDLPAISLPDKGHDDYVEESEYLKVYRDLMLRSDQRYFGLRFGAYLNLKTLGLILEISLNATGIEQSVLILQKYLALSFPLVSVELRKDNDYCLLEFNCVVEETTIRQNLLDMVLTIVYRELKLMLPKNKYPEIQLPYAELKEYKRFLQASIEGTKKHTLALEIGLLKSEINARRIKEIEYLLPQFLLMLNQGKEENTFALQVKNMILNMCCPELPDFDLVAKQFAMSQRSIQRKLMAEGYSFRKISDQIKKELSLYLMEGKSLKTRDISSILGYSEPSAYLHAVKRWGISI